MISDNIQTKDSFNTFSQRTDTPCNGACEIFHYARNCYQLIYKALFTPILHQWFIWRSTNFIAPLHFVKSSVNSLANETYPSFEHVSEDGQEIIQNKLKILLSFPHDFLQG